MLLSLSPAGDEFRVNGKDEGNHFWPRVAMDADGDFAVVWSDTIDASTDEGCWVRLFDAQGRPKGPDIPVESRTDLSVNKPTVAMDDAGDFVVAFQGFAPSGSSRADLYARRFNARGEPQGPEFVVNAPGANVFAGNPLDTGLAMDGAGNFALAWSEIDPATDNQPTILRARRFNAAGQPVGDIVRVDTELTGTHSQIGINAAMDDAGGLLIAWRDVSRSNHQPEIYARRYDGSGAAQGSEFRVNVETESNLAHPSIGIAPDGSAVVIWAEDSGESGSVNGRRVDASGAVAGSQFQVVSYPDRSNGIGSPASLAMADDGRFTVAWSDWDTTQPPHQFDGPDGPIEMPVMGVHFQQFNADASKAGGELILNVGNGHDNAFPAVAMDNTADRAVVTWSRDDGDPAEPDDDSFARLLSDGDPPAHVENQPPTTSGIADATVEQGTLETHFPLFDAFADVEDADGALRLAVAGNSNAALFSEVTIGPADGILALAYAPGASGTAVLTVRATDRSGAFVDATFNVTVTPGAVPAAGEKSVTGRLVQKAGRRKVGVAGVQVYLDADDDGVFDAGEASATTGADGSFALSGLAAGTYRLRLADGTAWQVAGRRNRAAAAMRPVLLRAKQRRVGKIKPLVLAPLDG